MRGVAGASAGGGSTGDELVTRAQQGDADAFRQLWTSLQPAVVRYLRMLDGPAAEDLAAETWLEVIRHLGRFRGTEAGFRSWVLSIAHHRHLDWRRRQARRPEVRGSQLYEPPPMDDAADTAMEHISTHDALAQLAGLPPDQAQAVMLRVVIGLDVAAVAGIMNRTPGSVRVLTHRGLRRLDRYLKETARSGEATGDVRGG
jgi:RNA polymerase sigma-70 factor, ECF subfamily